MACVRDIYRGQGHAEIDAARLLLEVVMRHVNETACMSP